MSRETGGDAGHTDPPPGARLAVVVAAGGLGLADGRRSWAVPAAGPAAAAQALADLDAARRPRWVWWAAQPLMGPLLAARPGTRPARCWDLAAVHRLLAGGSDDDPARVWAHLEGLDASTVPAPGQLDLLGAAPGPVPVHAGTAAPSAPPPGVPAVDATDADAAHVDGTDVDGTDVAGASWPDPDDPPVRPDGHLRPEWVEGGWADTPARARAWAGLALVAAQRQEEALRGLPGGDAVETAWSESAAALLAVEMGVDGVPVDVGAAHAVLHRLVGPPPADAADAERLRAARDAPLLRLLGPGGLDLRSPVQVRSALARLGVDLPDTRSWRLEQHLDAHPVVPALLAWRQAERFAVAYGYRWLEQGVRDGRLRGRWSASDGGAGRMTASAGVQSLPRELREAVRAEPGHLLVRADLGQVEPRVLAVVSGDRALARDAQDGDLYAPVAERLGVARDVAKVAVLAAMYGQTSGAAGATLAAMERSYPQAVGFLVRASERGVAGQDVRTAGGRRVGVPAVEDVPVEAGGAALDRHRQVLAGRGRFTRNAVVQGAAAELFKAWAATTRARLLAGGEGRVVMCLHDELLLHVLEDSAPRVAEDLVADLTAASARWCHAVHGLPVRFVADVTVVERWSQAKG